MAQTRARPLAPHLGIYTWGPHMAVSIINRVTGGALATAGIAVLTAWLIAIARGPDAYGALMGHATAWYGRVILIGLTWAYAFHFLAGLRHFVMDLGAGFELKTNKTWAWGVIIGSFLLTALVWLLIMWKGL